MSSSNDSFESEAEELLSSALTDNIWSLLLLIVVDTCATLICIGSISLCVLWVLKKRGQKKEERNKLGDLIQSNYWEYEDDISNVLVLLKKLKTVVIFREITALHILAYKYRLHSGLYGSREDSHLIQDSPDYIKTSATTVWKTIRKVERLFEMLLLQLPCKGVCPSNSVIAFSGTMFSLAKTTSVLWSDEQFHLLRKLVNYFCGQESTENLENSYIPDQELETLILARIPYVSQLYLNEDHFVQVDVNIMNDLKIDLRNKIRYIDTVLSKTSRNFQSKEKQLIESYYNAREICMRNNFIMNKNNLPDLIAKVGEESKLEECLILLKHLLRIICVPQNLKKVETDDKFFQFLMQLHETLYSWADTSSMIEVIERTRNNIFCYLRGFTTEQLMIDKEFTKAKLEHLEKELYRHLNYLTLRQVQESKNRRTQFRLLKSDPATEQRMRSFDSESSVYTMAMSASSFVMQKQASQDPASDASMAASTSRHEMLHTQRSLDPCSIDQASIVSGSSVYATAPSLCSGGQSESTPLMGSSLLPGTSQHAASPQAMIDRAQSPISSNDSDFFETAV